MLQVHLNTYYLYCHVGKISKIGVGSLFQPLFT